MDSKNLACLLVRCKSCNTQLQIASNEFKAFFNLRTAYPDKIEEQDKTNLGPNISKEDLVFLKQAGISVIE